MTTESTLFFWVGTNGLLLTITTGRGVFLNIGTYSFGIAATGIKETFPTLIINTYPFAGDLMTTLWSTLSGFTFSLGRYLTPSALWYLTSLHVIGS